MNTLLLALTAILALIPARGSTKAAVVGAVTLGIAMLGLAFMLGLESTPAALGLLPIAAAAQALRFHVSADLPLRLATAVPIAIAAAAHFLVTPSQLTASSDLVWLSSWFGLVALLTGSGFVLGLPSRQIRALFPVVGALALMLFYPNGWPAVDATSALLADAPAQFIGGAAIIAAAIALTVGSLIATLMPPRGGAAAAGGAMIAAVILIASALSPSLSETAAAGAIITAPLHLPLLWSGFFFMLGMFALVAEPDIAPSASLKPVGFALGGAGAIAWLVSVDALTATANGWLYFALLVPALMVAPELSSRRKIIAGACQLLIWIGLILFPGGLL